MDPPVKFTVVIVGAGMAGLGAAKTITDAGVCNILILEAQERVGGRTVSMPIDDSGNSYIDLGAQWIHGKDNPVFYLAKKANMLTETVFGEGQGLYMKSNGEALPSAMVQEVAEVVEGILEDCCQFVNKLDVPNSVGEFLTEKFNQYLDSCEDPPSIRNDKLNLFDWHKRYQIVDNSCNSLNSLSAKSWGLYKGGAEYNCLRQGYSSLVEHLIAQLPAFSIKTLCVVKQVRYSSDEPHAKVICDDGIEYIADHVIVTCPLGYLKENVDSLFYPPLPHEMTQAIHNLGFDTHNKVFLLYNTEWWSSDFTGIQFVWDSKEKIEQAERSWLRHVTGFDVVASLQGVLLGWVGGEGAVEMECLSDQDVSQHCTSVIREFMNRQDIPIPDKIFRSKWHNNKFVRGGFSYTKCDKDGSGPHVLAQPIYVDSETSSKAKHPVLLLAGEAVNIHYFATTHGAYMSGASQAQLIVDYIAENQQ